MVVTQQRIYAPDADNGTTANFIRVRGARLHNLKDIDLDIPRGALVAFTGISGSGKTSLAFGTIFAEAQQRYLESVAPYARRLLQQPPAPEVDRIDGLPPAVALQQRHGIASARSSVGSLTTLSNRLRMLFSRAGNYPPGQAHLDADCFSPNTPEGACPTCLGLGHVIDVTEASMVPDDSLSIRNKAIAAWPLAWHGQNLRDILVSLGFDIERPWRELSRQDRDWILFTEEQPVVRVYPGLSPEKTRRAIAARAPGSYQGTFTSARRYVLHTLSTTQSSRMRQRASQYTVRTSCPACEGRRLKPEALAVTFAGLNIADIGALPINRLAQLMRTHCQGDLPSPMQSSWVDYPERQVVARHIARDLLTRLSVLCDLGVGYLSLERSVPSLSGGEHQRLRLATQLSSELFGVVYVLGEPSSGLHPADKQALLAVLQRLKTAGNSVLMVEHDLALIANADWVVDVGPDAGTAGGHVLYSGPIEALRHVKTSHTARCLFEDHAEQRRVPRTPTKWLRLKGVTCNNIHNLDAMIPVGVLTVVTGVSGSGKTSLIGQALVQLVSASLGQARLRNRQGDATDIASDIIHASGHVEGDPGVKRLIAIDQKPIGRTPRSNLATYTGLFDHIRRLFAETPQAREASYPAGRFSFNLAGGRCQNCEGHGAITVELLFMPSVYSPCPACKGSRYNPETLAIRYRDQSIAEVLAMTVDEAKGFFADEVILRRPLEILSDTGLGYLRLGQPATELSGGEAQRIKLATELQSPVRTHTLYILDEPSAGLHPHDVEKLATKFDELVEAGHTVVVVEHNMKIAARSDWIIDLGPGGGESGGRIVAMGKPADVALAGTGPTARYLRDVMCREAFAGGE